MPLDDRESSQRAAERYAGDDERESEAGAIHGRQQRAAAGGRRAVGIRKIEYDAERRADAGRPADGEQHPEQRRAGETCLGQSMEPVLALQPRKQAEKRDAEQDRDHAADAVDGRLVFEQMTADVAEQRAFTDKDGREPEHEQGRTE